MYQCKHTTLKLSENKIITSWAVDLVGLYWFSSKEQPLFCLVKQELLLSNGRIRGYRNNFFTGVKTGSTSRWQWLRMNGIPYIHDKLICFGLLPISFRFSWIIQHSACVSSMYFVNSSTKEHERAKARIRKVLEVSNVKAYIPYSPTLTLFKP